MVTEGEVRDAVSRHWGLSSVRVEPHHGGMNSATWFVHGPGERWVAKLVPGAARRAFTAGLSVAVLVAAAGTASGPPVPTRTGALVADLDGASLALLTWVPGDPLGTAGSDQQLLAKTLARVHRGLVGTTVEDADTFHWVDPDAPHLALRPWLRPAVATALDALAALDPAALCQGLLHTDPAPEAFRRDPVTGACGLIDWQVGMVGPLLYDLASAVMYAGGPCAAADLIAAYLPQGPIPAAEVARGLPVLLRFRWAVQADYFARRIVEHDLTGIADPADNQAGLAAARRMLGELG
ncbi:aminoglycoside phosphotransferase family protein [Natronosporangium hydrolyticum]|uniref:Aminoglycoside phosphotransferase family protein n=1 Tax=Natronosporangium hydrolyticum TaxID=2811111 RepID=A0A895YDZ0_9ACTN|nr:phosphotransferase [Natronosporangium hydrolyticum]QSB12766.1 aminoglycoside phosphotransferase family protein [Natronosporangium hydrolyticum]